MGNVLSSVFSNFCNLVESADLECVENIKWKMKNKRPK